MTVTARRAATRDRMCDAALSVFAQRGVLGASVEEICEAAGFTRGAFYSNFESKDELCMAVLQRRQENTMSSTQRAIRRVDFECAGIEQVVADAARSFVETQAINPDEVLGLMELEIHAARSPEFRKDYLKWLDTTREMLRAALDEAVAERGFAFDRDTLALIIQLEGVCNAMMVENIIRGDSPTSERLIDYITTTIRGSLITPSAFVEG